MAKPAVLMSINRQPDSNTVEVADEVHQEIENLRSMHSRGSAAQRLLRSVEHRASESIGSVRDAIIIGLFLTGFIIWLFLRDLGTALTGRGGGAGDDLRHLRCSEDDGAKFQHDDAGRTRGRRRTCDR